LAASRTASTSTDSTTKNAPKNLPKIDTHAPRRISFAKIREPLEVPNLLALQTDSFDTLLGN
jgi:DNA-directed RNA polymerase subunit beta